MRPSSQAVESRAEGPSEHDKPLDDGAASAAPQMDQWETSRERGFIDTRTKSALILSFHAQRAGQLFLSFFRAFGNLSRIGCGMWRGETDKGLLPRSFIFQGPAKLGARIRSIPVLMVVGGAARWHAPEQTKRPRTSRSPVWVGDLEETCEKNHDPARCEEKKKRRFILSSIVVQVRWDTWRRRPLRIGCAAHPRRTQ